MVEEPILDANRPILRELFDKLKQKNPQLPFNELFKLFEKTHIYPDLLDIYDLKSIILSIAKSNGNYDKKPSFSYMGFEVLLNEVANKCFEKEEIDQRFKLLLTHIKVSLRLLYGVHVILNLSQDLSDMINSEPNSLLARSNDKQFKQGKLIKGSGSPTHALQKYNNNSLRSFGKTTPVVNNASNLAAKLQKSSTVSLLLRKNKLDPRPIQKSPDEVESESQRSPDESGTPGRFAQRKSLTQVPVTTPENPFPQAPPHELLTEPDDSDFQASLADKYDKLIELFNEFKKNCEQTKKPRFIGISPRILSFIIHLREQKVGSKYLLKMNFDLWRLKAIRKY
ncbi:unnamed protein product [Blepharisma stoltei]|uniref:Uncharacterized protein n=1 Tax=Blepharisma stoltei TaxID=1481888 RepID=A0AAU9KNP0_9CILI|nr:unnamed protein product [Blepharisma stoltei]